MNIIHIMYVPNDGKYRYLQHVTGFTLAYEYYVVRVPNGTEHIY